MKPMTGMFLALAAVATIGSGAAPSTQAACGLSYLLQGAPVHSNPAWCGGSYCYGTPAFSPNASGAFWSMTSGDPIPGAGDDSGTLELSAWLDLGDVYGPGYDLWYPGTLVGNWAQSVEIDGCIDNTGLGAGSCTCMAIFDEWDNVGYFGLFSDQRDSGSNHNFAPWAGGATHELAPVPPTVIVGTAGNETQNFQVQVVVPAPTAGLSLDPSCGPCAEIFYSTRTVVLPRGSGPPSSRELSAWPGPASAITPVGDTSTVDVVCDPAIDQETWVATELYFDTGFKTFFVSGDTLVINCGNNLAEPIDFGVSGRPTTSKPRKPRIAPARHR